MTYKRKEVIGDCTLFLGDCLDVMPLVGKVDAVVTDPPYPDYFVKEYNYHDGVLDLIDKIKTPKLIFWSAKADFPLKYSACHIWDKKTGCGSEYERIFEINGGKSFKVFRYYTINSTVAACFTGDIYNKHPSQKPIKLMQKLIQRIPDKCQTILDPFMGSGTTLVACAKMGRSGIGIELDENYFDIACKRVEDAYKQPDMFGY